MVRSLSFVYLDDIVIYAASLTEHQTKFHKSTERLRVNLKLQLDKCEFLRKEVNYLGHVLGKTERIKSTSCKRISTTMNQ